MKFLPLTGFIFLLTISIFLSPISTVHVPQSRIIVSPFPPLPEMGPASRDPADVAKPPNGQSSGDGCEESPIFWGKCRDGQQNATPVPKPSGYKPNDERLINAIQLFKNVSPPNFIVDDNPPPPCSANCFALKDMEEQKVCIKRCAACWDEKQCDQCGDDKQCQKRCYEEQIYCDYMLPKDGHGGTYLQCRWRTKTQFPPLCVEYKYMPSGECSTDIYTTSNIYRLNGVDLPDVYKCGNCTADVAGNVFCNFIMPTKLPGYNLSCVYRKLYADNGQHDYEFLCATVPFIVVDKLEQ